MGAWHVNSNIVLQGSVLGHILFTLYYINEICGIEFDVVTYDTDVTCLLLLLETWDGV